MTSLYRTYHSLYVPRSHGNDGPRGKVVRSSHERRRSRADVSQLNALAKAAAQASGESYGPELANGAGRWQAGDIVRTPAARCHLLTSSSAVRWRSNDQGHDHQDR
jgi:hypothetical protein